ncbi:putative FAD binding protein [Apodospora peruviana]|uniref:ferric-chelate reductase (NADPH) n=1 Tax=Apodospora peruviana TaxID=516989 RepID=A0AAE0MGP3_9PEZI|nr:putative FAD binding protein [Apodospora peruviana]
MDFQRRNVASLATGLVPTGTLHLRDARGVLATTVQTHAAPTPDSTIAPFNTGLNGVNQPMNFLFRDALWWTLGLLAVVVLSVRIIELVWAKVRLWAAISVSGQKQGYWKVKQWSWMPGVKKNLIYAPFWKKRHNREVRFSSAINLGTLPTRLQGIVLIAYLASNLAYMFVLNWRNENKYELCAELRGRSGTLAVVNMIPLFIFAARNNPLIAWLQISFDTYNLLHRWMGRVVVVEAVVHFIAWDIVQVADGGWESVKEKILNDRFIGSGMVATIALVLVLILSVSPIRHAFYETFLVGHIIMAFIILAGTWVHCVTAGIAGGLPQLPWVIAIAVLWNAERVARLIRIAYCNWTRNGHTKAIIEALPGEATRVTMRLPQVINVRPGQHAYLRFARIRGWENHPFSIAWFEHEYEEEILPTTEKQTKPLRKPIATKVGFVIGAHTGVTRKLFDAAEAHPSRAITMSAAFEGPYAGHHSLDSYGHCVLFAGATGITHQMSYLRHLIEGFNEAIVATRRITLVWVVRDYEALEWVRPWMDKVLRMPNRKELLQVKLFVTRPKRAREVVSPSTTVQMFPGRPNIPMLLLKEVHEQLGAMCVTVCGPGGLSDDVRKSVRDVQAAGTVVDFFSEEFSW